MTAASSSSASIDPIKAAARSRPLSSADATGHFNSFAPLPSPFPTSPPTSKGSSSSKWKQSADGPSPPKKRRVEGAVSKQSASSSQSQRATTSVDDRASFVKAQSDSKLRLRRAFFDIFHRHETAPPPPPLHGKAGARMAVQQLPSGRTRALREEDDDVIDLRTMKIVEDRGVLRGAKPGAWAIGSGLGGVFGGHGRKGDVQVVEDTRSGDEDEYGDDDEVEGEASDDEEDEEAWEEPDSDDSDEMGGWGDVEGPQDLEYVEAKQKQEGLQALLADFDRHEAMRRPAAGNPLTSHDQRGGRSQHSGSNGESSSDGESSSSSTSHIRRKGKRQSLRVAPRQLSAPPATPTGDHSDDELAIQSSPVKNDSLSPATRRPASTIPSEAHRTRVLPVPPTPSRILAVAPRLRAPPEALAIRVISAPPTPSRIVVVVPKLGSSSEAHPTRVPSAPPTPSRIVAVAPRLRASPEAPATRVIPAPPTPSRIVVVAPKLRSSSEAHPTRVPSAPPTPSRILAVAPKPASHDDHDHDELDDWEDQAMVLSSPLKGSRRVSRSPAKVAVRSPPGRGSASSPLKRVIPVIREQTEEDEQEEGRSAIREVWKGRGKASEVADRAGLAGGREFGDDDVIEDSEGE